MVVVLFLVVLFTGLLIYEEYNDFDREASFIRKEYIVKQKKTIRFDINRVLKFITYEYEHNSNTVDESYLKEQNLNAWGWMIGTGVYLDEVEKLILAEKSALKKRLIKYMMEILSLTVILFGIGLAGLSIVNHIIKMIKQS